MPFKIEGTTTGSGRILILEESDYSIVRNTTVNGAYSVNDFDDNNSKLVLCRSDGGETQGFSGVVPVFYEPPIPGSFGFQIKSNEHLSSGYTTVPAWDPANGGSLYIYISGLAFTGIFFNIPKADLQGKKIRFTWEKLLGHSTDGNYIHILDGAYSRTSSTDFPDNNHSDYVYFATKGGGYMWGTSINGNFTQTVTTTPTLSMGGTYDDVAVFLWFHDGASSNTGRLRVYNVEILDGATNEVISSMERGLTPVMENTTVVAEYGYYGNWNAFYA